MLTKAGWDFVRMMPRLRRPRFEDQLPPLLTELPWLSALSEAGPGPARHTYGTDQRGPGCGKANPGRAHPEADLTLPG